MADPSGGMHSYGTRIYVADYDNGTAAGSDLGESGAGGFARLAEVISINGVPMNSSVTRLTHLESPGKAHEKIPGYLDAGQVTFRFNYTESLLAALVALLPAEPAIAGSEAPAHGRKDFTVQFADGGQWYFQGFIQGLPFEVPEDDRLTVECTIEISGRPLFYEAA